MAGYAVNMSKCGICTLIIDIKASLKGYRSFNKGQALWSLQDHGKFGNTILSPKDNLSVIV